MGEEVLKEFERVAIVVIESYKEIIEEKNMTFVTNNYTVGFAFTTNAWKGAN